VQCRLGSGTLSLAAGEAEALASRSPTLALRPDQAPGANLSGRSQIARGGSESHAAVFETQLRLASIYPANRMTCWARPRMLPQPDGFEGSILGSGLRVVLAAELGRLGPTLVPGFLNDRWDVGVGEELVKTLLIPVKEHPDPVVLIGIAKDCCTLGPVLLSLLSALG
jgi:hypothetical protein